MVTFLFVLYNNYIDNKQNCTFSYRNLRKYKEIELLLSETHILAK